jgi:hypothetical protein
MTLEAILGEVDQLHNGNPRLGKLATLLVRAVNSPLSHTPTCFRIGSKFRCSIEAYRNALDERERLCVFREHGCELPANSIFDRTNTRYPQAIRCMLLSSELRKRIEKSACLVMTVRAIAYLAGQGQAMGHRRSRAVACRISRTLSSLEPPGYSCLCLRGNHQRAAEFNSMRSVPAPHATAVFRTSLQAGTSGSIPFGTMAVQPRGPG